MLISYIGVDFQCKGDRVYRLLDTTLTFSGSKGRQTLKYDIRVKGFANRPEAKSAPCSFSNTFIWVCCSLRCAMASFFFNEEELAAGKGVVHTASELESVRLFRKDNSPFSSILQRKLLFRKRYGVSLGSRSRSGMG